MTSVPSASSPRRAAVLGSPVAHSRSPILHAAAYRELGLAGWTYERVECRAEQLPEFVDGLGPEWVGLSVTMPGKFAALAYATERTERAVAVGSANTLVRTDSGWRADCTDVDGVTGALGTVGVRDLPGASVVVVGAGGTSRPALIALRGLGAIAVTVVSRDEERAGGALACARDAGLTARWSAPDDAALPRAVADAEAVVSTVPPEGGAAMIDALRGARVLLDAIYHPWPTPLAAAVEESGGVVVGGLEMLLHQAFGQVEQFTGQPAPRAAMERALRES
ncbi:shikimate dehydrogenase [Rhodococcus sp. BP-349]|uniref:shikimate dehydrogenase n=1 Tax=unclassified Rhodococcus (in: high G+C Gram-positive bacteria) TaxID=192944 RepID=UPI001C9A6DE9|nr:MULTISPECIES: shikimate dehydrogenase [unclassified Rhodococcus (in: high G+C Gram-positive bacteria)]MBY6541133.1 shikimate dehydrogenase [Rhodococcus sp. BP-363]MBY6544841.1 shikimate dehydrogenase [Rhodococcus sp. BP-369]MBY6564071.1 shikimate dehydrogenase [Rhodococcus sp. BP-370]MBY6578992.1 shikimate dehydrogenase [Rhodococcus sp. BP-364]MBY6588293.1 shikimate dehydrogenase [Rhodococcus sp. BP-358]